MTGYLSRAEARIRPADGQDAEAVARIFVETWQAAYPGILAERVLTGLSVERQFAYWRGVIGGREQSVFVADSQGVVGFAACGAARPRLDGYRSSHFMYCPTARARGSAVRCSPWPWTGWPSAS